jgi:hypothetical protein
MDTTQHVIKMNLTGLSLTHYDYFGRMVTISESYRGDASLLGMSRFVGWHAMLLPIIRYTYDLMETSQMTIFSSPKWLRVWIGPQSQFSFVLKTERAW